MTIQLQALRDICANWIRTTLGISADLAGSHVAGSANQYFRTNQRFSDDLH